MAIGWLTVLQSVPWKDVVVNAPVVADGAKKLWKAIAKNPPSETVEDDAPVVSAEAESIAAMRARLASAEEAVSDLHEQMLASSELIKALADQNTQLVKSIEVNRVRIFWLAGSLAVTAVVAVAALGVALAG